MPLNLPTIGSSAWGPVLNAALTFLDNAITDLQTVVGGKADSTQVDQKAFITDVPGYQIWNGTTWSGRPSGYRYVEAFSDGTAGSTRDPAAPSPTGAVNGDRWWKAVS